MKYPQLVSMPSAVSDWLEEQLEVRGIDALVYSRYVLSLLHTHTVDVICSDEDLYLSHLKKEVKSTIRCPTDWWRNADAEKLKRSEAVKCLMSTTEQNCEIESLIDELCAKLKEIKSDNTNKPETNHTKTSTQQTNHKKVECSAQEQAEKYYAAFPPLKRNATATATKKSNAPPPPPPLNRTPSKVLTIKWHQPQKTALPAAKKRARPTRMNRTEHGKRRPTDKQPQQHRNNYFKRNHKRNDGKKINLDQCVMETNIAEVAEEELTMYDDLPVDIRELLDSPSPTKAEKPRNDVELMNMRNTDNKIDFIPFRYGSNSIWSKTDISVDCWNLDETKIGEADEKMTAFTLSLMKLNHQPELSNFCQVVPGRGKGQAVPPVGELLYPPDNCPDVEKDDLLTSERSHFKPIVEKPANAIYTSSGTTKQQHYEDGATFFISNSLDQVCYKRSASGFLYMENEGQYKKYKEYNKERCNEFVLKFNVIHNEKACQTDELNDFGMEEEFLMITNTLDGAGEWEKKNDLEVEEEEEGDDEGKELMWRYETMLCDKCNNNTVGWENKVWLKNGGQMDEKWWGDSQRLRNIWRNSGGASNQEVCCTCINNSQQNTMQLRKDVSKDGEQLLSDLSSMQKIYMGCGGYDDEDDDEENEEEEEVKEGAVARQPHRCFTTDIVKPITKECRRRHSFISVAAPYENNNETSMDFIQLRNSWSFATRLEEDCLIQMTTVITTLRSVTL